MASSRSPYGERGLKSPDYVTLQSNMLSLSLRRAWIEIASDHRTRLLAARRSPYGERGLKFDGIDSDNKKPESLSLRRAWIEIKGFG